MSLIFENVLLRQSCDLSRALVGEADPAPASWSSLMPKKVLEKMVTPKCLGGPPVDLDRLNVHPLFRSFAHERLPSFNSNGPSESVQEFAARINKLGTQIFQSGNSAQNTAVRNANDQLLQSRFISGLRNDICRFVLSRDPLNLEESINAALIEEQNMKLNQIASEERSGLSSAQTENPVLSALADRLQEINLRVGRLQEASAVTARKSGGNYFNRRENVFKCFYCGIQGHRQAECRKRQRDERAARYQPPRRNAASEYSFSSSPRPGGRHVHFRESTLRDNYAAPRHSFKKRISTSKIADLEKAGIISKSNSQYNTPALFVKQREKWRLVLDFRKLNEINVTQDFVIPTLDNILHEISGSNYFSALDMKSAFNQIPLHFADRHKTAFSTPDGDKYQFNRLCFGLKNSPKAFQSIAQEVLGDLLHHGALVYIEDIILFTKTIDEHFELLGKVFERFERIHLKFNFTPPKRVRAFPTPGRRQCTHKYIMVWVVLGNFPRFGGVIDRERISLR
ncbi:retrovirus-related Pol polyprotein from transposon 17.6 [Trichonephila clavipes]|nr:retrovirus-related Pol polyprotein from transposon 17.6 [Trichonephila clavipes]